jgi:hypothetical protein
MTITPKTLTVTGVTAENKTYDSTTDATIDASAAVFVGLIDGDDVSIVFASASGEFEDKNAGTGKTVHISGIDMTGDDTSNYTITQPETTADITPLELTIGGTFSANDKNYDGTTAATINENDLFLVGIVGADSIDLDAVAIFVTQEVGENIEVVLTGSAIDGSDAENYSLSFEGAPTTTASIKPADPVDPSSHIEEPPYFEPPIVNPPDLDEIDIEEYFIKVREWAYDYASEIGKSKWEKWYKKGMYKTTVRIFRGKANIYPYDENGPSYGNGTVINENTPHMVEGKV